MVSKIYFIVNWSLLELFAKKKIVVLSDNRIVSAEILRYEKIALSKYNTTDDFRKIYCLSVFLNLDEGVY